MIDYSANIFAYLVISIVPIVFQLLKTGGLKTILWSFVINLSLLAILIILSGDNLDTYDVIAIIAFAIMVFFSSIVIVTFFWLYRKTLQKRIKKILKRYYGDSR